MKIHLFIITIYTLLNACSNDKQAQATNVSPTSTQPELLAKTKTNQTADEGITGYWNLKLEAYDKNENKILDDDERKKGIQNRYSFRFNADGSCQIRESFKGHYEVKTKGGNKILSVYRNRVQGEEDQDPPPDVYRIISLSKNELVLLEQEGNLTFWVFERSK
jgi:hypothetical protein